MAAGHRNQITTRAYKSGSIVYFEGDRSEYIYILKSGRVILSYLKPESGEEIKEEIKPGEFFGVKSSLGKYPREETAQTFGDIEVLVLTVADFERLVLGNIQVVKKMLRVFSNQLRKVGRAVREVLGETNQVNPQTELFKIGEYYYRNGRYDQALYAYKKYMEYYPDTKYSSTSMQRINDIQSGNIRQIPDEVEEPAAATDPLPMDQDNDIPEDIQGYMDSGDENAEENLGPSDDMMDFDFDDNSTGEQTEISSEMDDFLNDDIDDIDDFDDGLDGDGISTEDAGSKIEKAEGMNNSGNYSDAFSLIEEAKSSLDSDSPLNAEADYQQGIALAGMKKLKEALQSFSVIVKTYPNSIQMKKSLVQIGKIYKSTGNTEKAKTYFSKVAGMSPEDEAVQMAKKFMSELGL